MSEAVNKFFRNLVLIQQGEPGKPWYRSKRVWCAILSSGALLAQTNTRLGWLADPATQMAILIGLNLTIGLMTKSPTGFAWDLDNPERPGSEKLVASGQVSLDAQADAGPAGALKPPTGSVGDVS